MSYDGIREAIIATREHLGDRRKAALVLWLATQAGAEDPGAYVPAEELERAAGCGHTTLARLLRELEDDGWLTREWLTRSGHRVGCRFRLHLPYSAAQSQDAEQGLLCGENSGAGSGARNKAYSAVRSQSADRACSAIRSQSAERIGKEPLEMRLFRTLNPCATSPTPRSAGPSDGGASAEPSASDPLAAPPVLQAQRGERLTPTALRLLQEMRTLGPVEWLSTSAERRAAAQLVGSGLAAWLVDQYGRNVLEAVA